MTPHRVSSKSPNEIVPLTFDYSAVTDLVTAVVSLAISVIDGTDPDVATMLSGSPQIQDHNVVQLIQAGVDGVTYEVRCLAESGSERYELVGQLLVETIP